MEKSVFARRAKRLREELEENRLDGIVVVPGPNMTYFTGANSLIMERPFMLLVPVDGEAQLVAPAIEAGPYQEAPFPLKVHTWTDSQGSTGAIREAAKDMQVRGDWGVEGRTPFLFLEKLMKVANGTEFVGGEHILQGLREIKDPAEVALLKKSAKILSKSFEEFPEHIKAGKTELAIAKELTEVILSNGATKVDDMLVQSGARGADPHGLPTSKKVERGDGVIVDIGTTYEGYYADVTRTFSIGGNKELEKVYQKVLEAEENGIRTSGAGVRVGEVDAAARGVLTKAGMGEYFTHRTGHGLGLEVHEAPYIVESGTEVLKGGMCFTVEPGVYLRGKLGVRIEDNVIVDKKKGVATTDAPKEFGWWR